MRLNEQHQFISQGLRCKQRLMPFFNRSNNLDLILVIQSAGVSRGRNGLARTSQAKSSPNQKKTCSNTAPTTPTLSTRFISATKNSQSAILSACLSAVFSNRLTISPPQTMLYFAPNDVSFRLKRRFVSPQTLRRYCSHFGKKLILLVVFFRI